MDACGKLLSCHLSSGHPKSTLQQLACFSLELPNPIPPLPYTLSLSLTPMPGIPLYAIHLGGIALLMSHIAVCTYLLYQRTYWFFRDRLNGYGVLW